MVSEPDLSNPSQLMSSNSAAPFLPFRNSVHLSQTEASDLMVRMLSGEMSTEAIAAVLQFLRDKGETVAELAGFAEAVRRLGHRITLDQSEQPILDTCGTGGDGAHTFNISTATAFVAAGAGLRVAKHGNRKISSHCGSCDVLEQMGVPVNLTAEQAASCITEVGIGFLYAPVVHPSVRHAYEARQQLKGRTTFNLLGPLTNPVGARVQLMGAFSVRAAEMLAQVVARLGVERAFVVHGGDGLDEVTTTTHTIVFQVEDGKVRKGRWTPSDFGLPPADPGDLKGGDPEINAAIIQSVLRGEMGGARDVVLANAAAALLIAGHASDLKTAVTVAAESIETGAAQRKLDELREFATALTHENV